MFLNQKEENLSKLIGAPESCLKISINSFFKAGILLSFSQTTTTAYYNPAGRNASDLKQMQKVLTK